MSWSGFKKNVNRATTQVMMKTGHVEKTSDREYEVEERRYRSLESAALRLQKEARGYLDSLRAMTASQMRIAETIDAFYGDSGARDGVSRSYKQAVEDLDAETVKALDGPYRCVSPNFLNQIEKSIGMEIDRATIRQIENEWNWVGQNRPIYTRNTMQGDRCGSLKSTLKLMDYVYRTTVLEPINRFCAYFPDVNECIKKRNHKLLDYDSMRAKVKKLTEKPDKDPAKLPRTERETEQVHDTTPISNHLHRPSHNAKPLAREESATDLSVPSPPKALQRPEIMAVRRVQHTYQPNQPAKQSNNLGIATDSSILEALGCGSFLQEGELQHSPSKTKNLASTFSGSSASSAESSGIKKQFSPYPVDSSVHTSRPTTSSAYPLSQTRSRADHQQKSRKYRQIIASGSDKTSPLTTNSNRHRPTPFFNPSELEDIMAPLRAEFAEREANALNQAKAAYEQLNEQLSTELPQLIDLRVPYLDPSFEALVKIQLRFCAEAYSRMAQVQQYLDASTRDQYANGDLDARVEEVLGQIRDLSIAGTV